jgi:hypothetical protein
VGKSEGKKPLGRPWRIWAENIEKDLQEVFLGCMGRIDVAQDTDRWQKRVNAVM